jgi:hypothetical protein
MEPDGGTAAHCLPHPPQPFEDDERYACLYPKLLGRIGARRRFGRSARSPIPLLILPCWASPTTRCCPGQTERYQKLVNGMEPLAVAEAPLEGTAGLLSLDGRWFRSRIERFPSGRCS